MTDHPPRKTDFLLSAIGASFTVISTLALGVGLYWINEQEKFEQETKARFTVMESRHEEDRRQYERDKLEAERRAQELIDTFQKSVTELKDVVATGNGHLATIINNQKHVENFQIAIDGKVQKAVDELTKQSILNAQQDKDIRYINNMLTVTK